MRDAFDSSKPAAGLICLFFVAFSFLSFRGQHTPPSSNAPQSTPTSTRSPTPTRSPIAAPSPTPIPVARNFHRWGSITLFNGLPSDSVRAIAQTTDGVIWLGTDNGLAKFDGRRIEKFPLGDDEANRVWALTADSDGRLWIGTGNGAFVYGEDEIRPVGGTEGTGITAAIILGDLYFGTNTGLVLRVVKEENRAYQILPEPLLTGDGRGVAVTGVRQSDGKLLAGTRGRGAISFGDDGRYSEFGNAPRPTEVNSIAQTAAGDIWLGADAQKGLSGLYSIGNGSRAKRVAAPTGIVQAVEANDHGIWAGTERSGLFHVDESGAVKNYTFENTSGGLRSDTIFALFTDREGVIWIGTNRGVSRYDPQGVFQQTISNVPNSNFIRTLFGTWGAGGYAGTNRGLFTSDAKGNWTEVPGLRNRVIYAMTNRSNVTIAGTPEGVFELSGKKLFDGDVRGFATLDSRLYAAVFGRGVVDITDGDARTVYADETVTSVSSAAGSRFWIGTAGRGLFSFDGRTANRAADPEELKSGTIWNMFDGRDGTLLIAGQHGVFTFRDGKAEQIIAAEDVRDVSSRDGQVWAATASRGLIHARFEERIGWMASSLGFEQGMPSDKAFLIRPYGENEWMVATNRGIVRYMPGTVAPTLIPVRILSQRLHEPREADSTIELDYPQNSLLVEVAGQSSRTFPEEFQYDFVLKDSSGGIIGSRFSNDPQFAVVSLRPGDYAIETRGFNRDLLASESLVIKFSVRSAPFPWTAAALAVLLAIALIMLVWAVIERRRISHRNRELAAARFDLANEAERERNRIARDLHDQTLADLRNLMLMSDNLSPQNPQFRNEIESVSIEIRRICEDLSPSVLENVGLVAALEFLLGHSIENHEFKTAGNPEETVKFPLIVELQVYRIAQEILTNIKHHSNADRVGMCVESGDGGFVLTIRDNGIPFDPDESAGNGRGISNIRARAQLIGARIDWARPAEGGNLFTLAMTVVEGPKD